MRCDVRWLGRTMLNGMREISEAVDRPPRRMCSSLESKSLASISNRTRYTCKRWSAPRLRSAAAWCGSICGASGEHLRAGAGGEEGGCAHARSFEQLGHSSWIVGRSSSRLLAESPSSGRCLMPSIGIVTDTGVLLSARAQRWGSQHLGEAQARADAAHLATASGGSPGSSACPPPARGPLCPVSCAQEGGRG